MEYKVQEGQCLLDIAIVKCGGADALPDIVEANPGLEFHSAPTAGSVINIPDGLIVDVTVAEYFSENGVEAANWDEGPTGDYNADDYDNNDYNT